MDEERKYLCIRLDGNDYAIDLTVVREVLALPPVTPVPQSPPHFRGLINIRGEVLSVYDLRQKLGLKGAPAKPTVIILDIKGSGLAVTVDEVVSVLGVRDGEKGEVPSVENARSNLVTGVVRRESGLILILDPSKLFNVQEVHFAKESRAA